MQIINKLNMNLNNSDIQKIKSLAKDEQSFNEILSIIDNNRTREINDFIHRVATNSNYFFLELQIFEGDEHIISYSPNVELICGISAEELQTDEKKLTSLIIEEDIIKVKKIFAEAKNAEEDSNFEVTFRLKKPDGNLIWLKKNLTVHVSENSKQLFAIYTNITDFINREEALMKIKESYRAKNAAKDKFISIVSHDLRAPFTSLLGFSEILLKENDISSDDSREYLEYIYEAAKNELQLINDLLDWSRLQSGKINLNISRTNLYHIVSLATSVLTGNAIRKNISVKLDIPDSIYVFADERLLGQAVKNLLSNAIKFTPPGKNIYISAGKFNENTVEVVVKDEGRGIPEEHQDKIFKIDEKFSLEGTEGEKGSGLGLTLVKEIVEKHGGNIWFYSKENEGTEFHFTIPEAHTSVLVVEDDLSSRKLICDILKDNIKECEIIEAENGYEALTKIEKEIPALIVTDHEMPLMNGFQFVEAAKKRVQSDILPVVIVSGKLNDEIKNKYESLGVNEIIEKPVLPQAFGSTVKEMLK